MKMEQRVIIENSGNGMFAIPSAPIWMTMQEIADLFCLFSQNIRKEIHAIYKNQELYEYETHRYVRQSNGISYDVYNLQMVIALAFRINSQDCRLFRKFVTDKLCQEKGHLHVFLRCESIIPTSFS